LISPVLLSSRVRRSCSRQAMPKTALRGAVFKTSRMSQSRMTCEASAQPCAQLDISGQPAPCRNGLPSACISYGHNGFRIRPRGRRCWQRQDPQPKVTIAVPIIQIRAAAPAAIATDRIRLVLRRPGSSNSRALPDQSLVGRVNSPAPVFVQNHFASVPRSGLPSRAQGQWAPD
jgi:hypothetical protein